MFNPPRDLLKEYLSAGIQAEQGDSGRQGWKVLSR